MTTPEAQLPPELAELIDQPESTQLLVAGMLNGRAQVGVVCKRTYRIGPRGGWESVDEDDQDVVFDCEADYYESESPFVSPIAQGNDTLFRPGTDVVVQGSAYALGSAIRRVLVQFRLGGLRRDIIAHGDRRLERDRAGALRFTEAEPFESIPLRYDRAYGGVDLAAWMANAERLSETMRGLPFDEVSPYHYPRNPAGSGYLLSTEPYDLGDLIIPSLEYEFDPITPARMVVGAPENWPGAPLPAGMDWYGGGWFPRLQYLGASILPDEMLRPVAEQQHGWATADLLDIPYVMDEPTRPPRPEFGQAASPGMVHSRFSAKAVAEGIPVKIVNMHPNHPELRMVLPREWPRTRVGLHAAAFTELEPSLAAITIRPADQEVVMTWCALTETATDYTPQQYAAMPCRITWRRERA